MEVTVLQAVGIGLVALFAYMVDFCAYAQWDRPIFTCMLVGFVLGDMKQALILGANLELLYMGTMSIGAALPPDIYAGGILGVAFAIVTGTGIEGAVTLCLPIASLALAVKQFFYTFFRGYCTHRADHYASIGDADGVARMHIFSLLMWVPMAMLVGFAFYSGSAMVQTILDSIPKFIMNGISVASGMIPALGFAMLAKLTVTQKTLPFLFLGFALVSYLSIDVTGVAIFGVIAAVVAVYFTKPANAAVAAVEVEDDDNEF